MKRQELEANKFVFSLVDEIHDLIVENKDTYKNPEKLEDIEKEANLKKRNYQQQLYNYGESELIYPISSSGDKVILLGYLPKKLSEKVKKNRENDDFHLPLLSQGKCNQDLDDDYDQSSASRGIDIIIIDTKFNFEYEEFSNTEDRSAKCKAVIKNGKSEVEFNNDIRCENIQLQHGQYVANSVGGLNNGSAGLYNVNCISRVAYAPCIYNNTICVGEFDSGREIPRKDVDKKAGFSNHRKEVDIYAPYFVDSEILINNEIIKKRRDETFYSSPIMVGIIATIMSNHPEIEFNKTMQEYLLKNALPFV
ncbi:hypothetical protein LY90DRAFT_515657 [Neocallimastix californiae]|uniref:Peptidase S8/S53 domain-containing protein n=1 Tax=Neocallimastix californiae TaxID=1754190 RepID=A0A1Y2AI01_9FUNG|nr:hypothetical protein LY90DRAFT_515657 [Neocallimastix californiae]|eukprot:ORY22219.1 hypothetical protein LY90DRAFT_515657 [Neocallimastix californiae]